MLASTIALVLALATSTPARTIEELQIKSNIELYAHMNGIDPERMLKLAKCESGLVPNAYNKTDPHGGAKGLFQFLQPTWDKWSRVYGGKMDIWDPLDQTKSSSE